MDMFGLSAVSIGAIFIYGGIKGYSPLKAIENVITGKNPNESQQYSQLSSNLPSVSATAATSSITGGSSSSNQAVGQMLASQMGWGSGQEWNDLVSLWNRESGWSNTADTRVTHAGGDNSSSTVFAYGIAQARPYNKMPQAGWPPDKGGQSDPTTQIQWGLQDIQSTYGSPSAAWAHEQQYGWY